MLARGPGMDVFTRAGAWPAVRKTVIDYHAAAFPGDVLRFHQTLTHRGRTSFTMRQTARRVKDDASSQPRSSSSSASTAEGRPFRCRRSSAGSWAPVRPSDRRRPRVTVNGVTLAVEVRGEGPPCSSCTAIPSTARSGRTDRRAGRLPPDRARLSRHGRVRRARPGLQHGDLRRGPGGAARRARSGRGRAVRAVDGGVHRLRIPAALARPGPRPGAHGYPGRSRHGRGSEGAGCRRGPGTGPWRGGGHRGAAAAGPRSIRPDRGKHRPPSGSAG